MKRTLLWLAALAAIQVGLTQPARAAETNAAIPYKMFEEIFQPITTVDPAKLEVQVLVTSTNQDVRPSDITLTIHSDAKGLIPVPLGTNGQVIKFPLEKDLHRENPLIVANQPANSMRFTVTIQLPLTNSLTFPYRRLADGVAEMNKSIKAQAGFMLSWFAPKIDGVIFFFPKTSAGKATVEIASASGKLSCTADKDGRIKLKLNKSLIAENPDVKVSEQPQHIVPDMSNLK